MHMKSVLKNVPWIVNSGASDHMTQESKLFNSYIPCSGKHKVLVANGLNIPVHGKWSIVINKHITLDSVLHVPEMSTNLLSISKLMKSQNYSVTFFSNRCVFQDLIIGKIIGNAEKREDLYYLIAQDWKNKAYQVKGSPTRELEIRLQHERLGHLNFASLKIMYPDLFKGSELSFLKCEICEPAKSHRVPYPLRNNRCDLLFPFIHTNIWGPSMVTGVTGQGGLLVSLMIALE